MLTDIRSCAYLWIPVSLFDIIVQVKFCSCRFKMTTLEHSDPHIPDLVEVSSSCAASPVSPQSSLPTHISDQKRQRAPPSPVSNDASSKANAGVVDPENWGDDLEDDGEDGAASPLIDAGSYQSPKLDHVCPEVSVGICGTKDPGRLRSDSPVLGESEELVDLAAEFATELSRKRTYERNAAQLLGATGSH